MIEIFKAGGWVMWPLLACSLVAVAIAIERLFSLRRSRLAQQGTVERLFSLADSGQIDRAVEVCREQPGILTNIMVAGLELGAAGEGEAVAKEAIEDAGRHETTKFNRFLGTLGTIVAISPLLGLFGTVVGMIEVFRTISEEGAGQAEQLAGGISQALITTASGLLIAIPALVVHNYLTGRVTSLVSDLEHESLRLLRSFFRARRRAASDAVS